MGLLTDITDAIGLTDTGAAERAAQAAQFNPFNVQLSYGGVDYDPSQRLFTTQIDPRLTGYSDRLLGELGGINAGQQLDLMRQMAAPFEEQQYLNLENRLFSQGLLGASGVDQPGGARRSLFDAQQQADMMRQLQARDWANQQRAALLGGIGTIQGMEQGLFGPAMGMGQLGAAGQQTGAQLMMQGAMSTQNFFGALLGGGIMGFMGR